MPAADPYLATARDALVLLLDGYLAAPSNRLDPQDDGDLRHAYRAGLDSLFGVIHHLIGRSSPRGALLSLSVAFPRVRAERGREVVKLLASQAWPPGQLEGLYGDLLRLRPVAVGPSFPRIRLVADRMHPKLT